MPWDLIQLNSGYTIPSIAFGTWTLGNGQGPIDQVEQALANGYDHIDTAQSYRNEAEVGTALHEDGSARGDLFITTKYSGTNGLDIATSIQNSLDNVTCPLISFYFLLSFLSSQCKLTIRSWHIQLGTSYVDLYLIHSPRLAVPDIPTAWREMEDVHVRGQARSIGVSNFNVGQLETLVASAKIVPAVNQILLHPYVYQQQLPILEYAAQHGIIIEAYSALIPVTKRPGGPLDAPLRELSTKFGATPDQILLAWVKAKGAVAVTTSSKKARLQGYLAAGDIALSQDDVAAIDKAGAIGEQRDKAKGTLHKLALGALVGASVFGLCSYFNVRIF
ncbi:Aldo keto reductase [Coniophora puteana RWD-64-598 SS2]|uniref:Aldo keto reductase n=1 Tax=Coniophora puteana (strain RWD-64-598) TaxID=741705 RepID=R7SGS6_CONPW|nr:Aldo keto reductase [Coniophora puteana RWD-64-598 SS2]EIW74244.1 Aldo keto reductase [Coniophora puteana RWD-64-598 SS2]